MSLNKQENNPLVLSEKSIQIQKMFDKISNKYDFLNRLLSAGQDTRWRNKMICSFPENTSGTLYDVACGTGDVLFHTINKRKDYKTFYGFDISAGMLEQAKIRARKNNVNNNLHFIQASAEALPVENNSADCLTISFGFRNVDNRDFALKEFNRVLKTSGTLFILEFFPADNTFFAKLFDFYFKKILPKIGGLFSDRSAYEYLPNSVSTMPSAENFSKMLSNAGFVSIEQTKWLGGATRLFKATKKS
ncbi:bifunctional demethylmenaquinone methyltransferase/2-methoxy-6-polyprenyl-1,4-benzoquinol methylase UbiE [Pigmentibacter sp. JX0631]|uniref:bifunctional demethylmenaquinone methyltransferase/2-methoxy-6-polyprenyl-1,4-benzoquinol methylase UbiE n=1 Tax=Pigmentibacter sp. JX0631 TaxID=2976982 RepID=UPI0024688E71|nr:bifunctional demethylmenaquinone methyltransferase/2-methoxy-6-polyprenyl-1,4-benzoquinol methylase UbiE [Pigmentibacter sp. JX0631]WGL59358.1 bifunctional demethylmenaquinone methyltransferase/2-methoxy-6-polyprenyl-1,4-benzoquinol methylase UbiE [Pigmentibacter sp. JX0631]